MVGEKIAEKLIERYNPTSVLFVPYKEEMWDTMKTIYDSFERRGFVTGIMPMPYFTLDNGKIHDLKMEFDYNNFPMMLKEGYSTEYGGTNKWDIIIFHYPYDNLNNVTRPVMYSNELKAFCYHLVLVSYAVVGDRLPLENEVVYGGVKNSDLVITETEEQAEVANQFMKKHGFRTEFVGWGSAKYDMIDLVEIPKEWEVKGEGKRKIFLQTGLVPYLKDRNKLDKVEALIRKYINDPNVCLIWRPHPLLRDTIIAHHRGELRRFHDLMELVQKSDKDIWDESKLPETPIKFADEMISDASSLVILWKKTGKKFTEV